MAAKANDGRIPMPVEGPKPTTGHGAHSTSEKHSPQPKSVTKE